MTLADGLDYYKQYSDSDWGFTLKVESAAANVVQSISLHRNQPSASALDAAHDLLMDIEKWKAMCLKERMGNAERNSKRGVWDAFQSAIEAKNDLDAILAIMQLKGFGSSRDEESGQRRAKVATAALRFLRPDEWGVVDWRTAAMLGFLNKANGDIDQALILARKQNAGDLRETFDIIDERGACAINQMYRDRRTPGLRRAADVEMAIFGLSLIVWPIPKSVAV